MAKSKNLQQRSRTQHLGVRLSKTSSGHEKRQVKASEKKEWKNAVCSVCLEFPHNAVLLLCSSYDKGCRPYMCATSHRYSNCLEQYKKAYMKVTSEPSAPVLQASLDEIDTSEKFGFFDGKGEISELLCPLCRGQVKGWTLVEPARRYLNRKKRTCMQDNCSFVGTYKELKKHVKMEHPLSRPRDVDPSQAEKWKKLENERDISDVFSTIRSTMPGAIVIGDYVIERNHRNVAVDFEEDGYLGGGGAFFRLPTYGGRWNTSRFPLDSFAGGYDSLDDEEFERDQARAAVAARRAGYNNGSVSRNARTRARLQVSRQSRRLRSGR